ncbi:MAG: efflux RND transporter periplasmic adaptor subunit, partial [Candidatus Omnitrophica bacterium]|nr:efflux RND transporter periplasmic adaptor subunit [Candidatus Omnitrophota bacterium]
MTNQIAGWKKILIGISIIAAVIIGFEIGRGVGPEEKAEETATAPAAEKASTSETGESSGPKWWTCSMHPQVKLPSGDMKCPICFMDLIPMEEGSDEGDIPSLKLSERARFLAEVETAEVVRREVTKEVRLVGKIRPDETKLSMITAWVPGRLDRLFVDYTGMEVRKGDHLVELYSPELYSAQQELLQAIQSYSEMKGSKSDLLVDTSMTLIQSSKNKLIRLGLTENQVAQIVESGTPSDTLTIYSPASGIVTAREGTEGMYVKEGSMIYTIADLSEVWLLLDAYESDVQWLHYGQTVDFETEAYPGEIFSGKLSFISPVLDERSRTVTLRVNVPNKDLKLKPGMFARAHIHAIPSAGGKVIAPEMEGKWLCPMHPEVVEDFFGFCPICGMPLETAQSLGYVTVAGDQNLPLVIPDTAPLITGKRAIVYVEEKNEDELRY